MKLIKASDMPKAFTSLFNIYAHELSIYNPWLGTQIDMDGNYVAKDVYEYIYDKSNEAYCIVKDERLIGFVVFSYSDNEIEDVCYIAEMFLLVTSRRLGICESICKQFWEQHTGTCILHVLKDNVIAATYWEKLIQKCGYTYKKQEHDSQMIVYEIQLNK